MSCLNRSYQTHSLHCYTNHIHICNPPPYSCSVCIIVLYVSCTKRQVHVKALTLSQRQPQKVSRKVKSHLWANIPIPYQLISRIQYHRINIQMYYRWCGRSVPVHLVCFNTLFLIRYLLTKKAWHTSVCRLSSVYSAVNTNRTSSGETAIWDNLSLLGFNKSM